MSRKAIIETASGLVLNVIEIEDTMVYATLLGQSLIDGTDASPGDTWNGSRFNTAAPVAPDPAIVRRGELAASLLADTATIAEVREYLVNRDGIVASEE